MINFVDAAGLETENKEMLFEEGEVDMRSFRPAGGPILLNILELPPQPKVINNWTIKNGMEYRGRGYKYVDS